MYCVKCGKEVKEGTKFCTNCGAEVEAKKEKKEEKDEKLTYSQNKSIETTSNPTPVEVKPENTGDGKGTASLVLGIISLLIWCVTPITALVGLILGICAKKSGKKVAGIILNSIALGLYVIVFIIFWSFGMFATILEDYNINTPSTPSTPSIITPSVKPGKVASTGTVTFDGFEMTLGSNYTIVTDTATSSSYYGKDIIKLPVTIKNVSASGDHLNMFYYDYYAPNGDKIDSVRSDFGSRNDAIDYVHVNSGESKLQYFYIIYSGNGKYQIKFHNYKEDKAIEFTINK